MLFTYTCKEHGGIVMRIAYTETDVNLLAHLMKEKAVGQQGILDIGNVGVNRVMCDCLDFKGIPATNES